MFINIEKIKSASHVLLVTKNDSFANSSALYSYILTLHKKVSLEVVEPLDNKFSFLPWFDKARQNRPSTADLIIEVESETIELYKFFDENSIKINQKMATALYTGLFIRYGAFMSSDCDGTIFAVVSRLLELKADKNMCYEFLCNRVPLSYMRLKEKLLKSLLLRDNAKHAFISVSDEDLKSSGATLTEATKIMNEFLKIVHLERVTLLKSDANNKIIKEISIEKKK